MRTKYMVVDITLAVEEGDQLGVKALSVDGKDKFIAERLLASTRPSDAHFDVARRWFEACLANHPECEDDASSPPKLPTRVIDVACDGQTPRLVESTGRRAQYATLSHCWGRSPAIKTELESLRLRQTGIPLEILPKTFVDAIIMCRKLGILYLWIDSLCIVQDDKGDWEYHSSVMGSIFYNSTLTLAATDAPDSSAGLFIPATPNINYPWLGTTAVPRSFANDCGQVYVTWPSWSVTRSSVPHLDAGILQSRGWVMQEKALSPRSLHFMMGQMVWECSKCVLAQGGSISETKTQSDVRRYLKTLQQTCESSYILLEDEDDDDEDVDGNTDYLAETMGQEEDSKQYARQESCDPVGTPATDKGKLDDEVGTAIHEISYTPDGRSSKVVDYRPLRLRDHSPPMPLDRYTNSALYHILEQATYSTIYTSWYDIVSTYSSRRLTFPSDKLPALAGIASRLHAITKDDYLAGHWRMELERSLFWTLETESDAGNPGRVQGYRAPSWSWASMNGLVIWRFPDLTPGGDTPAPVEILDAEVQVDGQNPFGCVTGGKIVMKVSTLRADWNPDGSGWRVEGTHTSCGDPPTLTLTFLDFQNTIIGYWEYDDVINGILPGPPLTEDVPLADVYERSVPHGYFGSVRSSNIAIHGKDSVDSSTLWKRGTYVPEELVLVKGPTRPTSENEREWYGRTQDVEVLVLARTHGPVGEYRRVGVGRLGSWDDSTAIEDVLSVV
ncbi:HET-domain-containing protein [Ophiobolus disseminans]|uniref:HET-domain-containing protein n=1 Tax=Ophiobolus disseminans TaxID=1469910 RepID=A0A6A7A1G9_9PLEO|nr:HET-domain-containing protein [Ophiobolus disseminans]